MNFSIGIPAYKNAYLKECISSILNQTYQEFEIIIVNDCSPYPLDEIIAEFEDSRIRYYKNEINTGAVNVANNYNKCLDKAEGDFFVLFGDDDKMEPDYLEEFAKLIHKWPDLDVYHCRSKIIDENSEPLLLTPSWPEFESVYDNIWHRVNGNRIMFIADYVYRVSALQKKGGYFFLPLGWGTDDITSFIAMGNKGIAHTNKPLLNYRRHPATISSIGNHELKMDAILQIQQWYTDFLRDKPEKEVDLIIYKDLVDNIDELVRKQKIYTMSASLRIRFFKNLFSWISRRKKYRLSFEEIFYSVFIYLKEKRKEKKY